MFKNNREKCKVVRLKTLWVGGLFSIDLKTSFVQLELHSDRATVEHKLLK